MQALMQVQTNSTGASEDKTIGYKGMVNAGNFNTAWSQDGNTVMYIFSV